MFKNMKFPLVLYLPSPWELQQNRRRNWTEITFQNEKKNKKSFMKYLSQVLARNLSCNQGSCLDKIMSSQCLVFSNNRSRKF